MKDKLFLMIPGPTPVPESVMLEIAKHPIGHRSGEFSKILHNVYENSPLVYVEKGDQLNIKPDTCFGLKFDNCVNAELEEHK